MKKLSLLLLITLLSVIPSFSQTTSKDSLVISSEQLKNINLIFAEHSKLKEENVLLWKEINTYKQKVELHEQADSLNTLELTSYQKQVQTLNENVAKLNRSLKRQKTFTSIWRVGGITVSVGLLVWALLK